MLDKQTMEQLKFDEKGLIPAIVVDGTTGQVLTLAYMNKESLDISIKEERTCFWSRSRQELWRKGETSGAVQHIIDITADCDYDALVVRVNKEGPHGHAPGPEGESQGGVLLLLPLRKGHRQDPQKGGGGVHRSHHRRQGRGQEGDHLRDRRPGLPRDGPHAPAGHQPGGGPGRAGLPARHRQKGEAGEDDLIVEI